MGNAFLVQKAAGAFNKVRTRFFTESSLKLLKPSTTTRTYDTITTITDDWFFDTEKNEVFIAKTAAELQTAMSQATHLQIGSGDIYVISTDDTKAPDTKEGSRAYWTIPCEKFTNAGQFANLY